MYSAYDLFQDIMRGQANSFIYDGETFLVTFDNKGSLIVHYQGLTATNRKYNNECLMDLQGMAACLRAEKRNLWFDQEGEFCDEANYDPTKRPRHKILESIRERQKYERSSN